MNLRQIEVFHAVFLHGTVSAAARALNVNSTSGTLQKVRILKGSHPKRFAP